MESAGMTKQCTIVLQLVVEADGKSCSVVAEDIEREMRSFLNVIPWAGKIKEIKVKDE